MLLQTARLSAVLLITVVLKADCVLSEDKFSDYNYGDLSISYDTLHYDDEEPDEAVLGGKTLASKADIKSIVRLPLCCPEGEVYDTTKCILSPPNFDWTPKLDGAVGMPLAYEGGFPNCEMKLKHVETYQKEVHFNRDDGKVFLPYHVQLSAVLKENYCIAKIYDPADHQCEDFQTKIFTCLKSDKEPQGLMWTAVAISHLLIFLTLLTYFCWSDLRCLQGQYMICFLISLLIYDLCLYPLSQLPLHIGDVSCIALGAVKYFFFCGVFLWFNTICYDIWRTLRNKQDISGRRRFLLYSAYSWVIGAILTTVVLVLPYMKDGMDQNTREDPLRDKNYKNCKLKMEMNMILQIAQFISLFLDLIMLSLASCSVCGYTKFGNGLPRCDASLCIKQGWKLFLIMVAHMVSSMDVDIIMLPVPLWLYILLESVAVFGILAYRRTILKKMFRQVCHSDCIPNPDEGAAHEKGQLTMT